MNISKMAPLKSFTSTQDLLDRLHEYECLEHSLAKHLEATKHVRLFEEEMNLDSSSYQYPFGKAGKFKLTHCEWTDKGRADWALTKKDSAILVRGLFHFIGGPQASAHRDRIVFTQQGALKMVAEGLRDQLVTLNSGPTNAADIVKLKGFSVREILDWIGN